MLLVSPVPCDTKEWEENLEDLNDLAWLLNQIYEMQK